MKITKNSFKRRDFVKRVVAGSVLAGSGLSTTSCSPQKENTKSLSSIEKIKLAMLTMQRASWEQGVAAQALLESREDELVYLMAKEAALRQANDGRLSVLYTDNGVTDPAASGEMVFRMAQKSGDKDLINAHEKMLDYLLTRAPRSDNGTIYHTLDAPEIWIDSMYMAPPYLCVAGQYDECMKQVEGVRAVLWDKETGLHSHRWHDGDKKFINKKFWGVGNGWAIAGLARIIDVLPESHSTHKETCISYAQHHIKSLLPFMREDGLFHNDIDEPTSFVEINFPQMLAYAIFRGIKSGWLGNEYLESALKMRQAVHSQVDEYGFVNNVCGAPWFNSQGRATEGQAFFLLMEAAFTKLMEN